MVEARNARETQWSVDVQGEELMQFLWTIHFSNLIAPDSKNFTHHKNPTSRYSLPTFQEPSMCITFLNQAISPRIPPTCQATRRLVQGQRHYSRHEFYC